MVGICGISVSVFRILVAIGTFLVIPFHSVFWFLGVGRRNGEADSYLIVCAGYSPYELEQQAEESSLFIVLFSNRLRILKSVSDLVSFRETSFKGQPEETTFYER